LKYEASTFGWSTFHDSTFKYLSRERVAVVQPTPQAINLNEADESLQHKLIAKSFKYIYASELYGMTLDTAGLKRSVCCDDS
jgi:hypothetical protein